MSVITVMGEPKGNVQHQAGENWGGKTFGVCWSQAQYPIAQPGTQAQCFKFFNQRHGGECIECLNEIHKKDCDVADNKTASEDRVEMASFVNLTALKANGRPRRLVEILPSKWWTSLLNNFVRIRREFLTPWDFRLFHLPVIITLFKQVETE